MKFQRETVTEVLKEAIPLFVKHYHEIAHFKDIELKPDFEGYLANEQNSGLRVFTARDDSNTLCGYQVFFLRTNHHYKDSLQAYQDILYIDKERRGFGYKFIKWCDEQLKADGVQVVYQHIKASNNFGPLLERMNYELVDLIFAKRLDK